MHKGHLCFVLHAHLPYVRHPEHRQFLEERWFYEAVTEAYIPLIHVFERLICDNIPFRLTISLSPTLLSMLSDPLLQERYLQHLNRLIKLSDKEAGRTYNTPFHDAAILYQKLFRQARQTFLGYDGNLVKAFKRFRDTGSLEIITSTATHSILPLINVNKYAVHAQINTAIDVYHQYFENEPTGIWLPECAYASGIDTILKDYGLGYFLLETHGLLFASPRPRYGIFAPILCPSGMAAFGRDPESSKQVWCAKEGYPGDFDYREFYRDIGHDLNHEYIKPYIHPDGIRVDTGIKYHRITGKSRHKDPYIPWLAEKKAATHARHFVTQRQLQIKRLNTTMDRTPIIVAPYDAELFGHWWFEGPLWLEQVIRHIHSGQKTLGMITPGDYLKQFHSIQTAIPASSSWGQRGYNEMWLNEKNSWIYRHLHAAGEKMVWLAKHYYNSRGFIERALNQAARELMLAQSSDWAFMMSTGSMTGYAVQRTKNHLCNFHALYSQITENKVDITTLRQLEERNNLFPKINFRSYQTE